MKKSDDISQDEFKERLVYSLIRPAVRFAMRIGLPLKALLHWVKLVYFQELRNSGMTIKEASDALNVSVPTAARLSRALKTNFYRPERDHRLPQRIEFMLWAEPLSRARIHQCLPSVSGQDIDAALAQMMEDKLIDQVKGLYTTIAPEGRFVQKYWSARIGSLNRLLDNLGSTVQARLLDNCDDAFARTVELRVAHAQRDELHTFYEQVLWPKLVELDERAKEASARDGISLSIMWSRKHQE